MSSTISALTNGTTVQSTDRIPAARSPYAPGDNVYLTPDELKAYATAPITLAYADVATETSAGNLIDGQLYNITGFPAFSSGIQLTDVIFQAFLNSGLAALNVFGVATVSPGTNQVGLTMDWYNGSIKVIGINYPLFDNVLTYSPNDNTSNAIDYLRWDDATKVYRSTIQGLTITNFTPATDSLVITNSFIQSGSSIDMAGFTGLVLDHVNLGFACDIIVTADSITCQDIRTGSNNTIYLPGNGINGGIWGSNNTIGGASLGFSQFDNITMGNKNEITPDIDGTWSIQNCEWGDRKTHVIKSSFDGCFWIGNVSTFAYVSDMSTDVDGTGAWGVPSGYGVILMSGAAPASIVAINNQIPIHCLNFGTVNVFSNASGIIFETVPVNVAGALAVGTTVTSLTTGVNNSDSFDVVKDSNGTDTIIKNITLTP